MLFYDDIIYTVADINFVESYFFLTIEISSFIFVDAKDTKR